MISNGQSSRGWPERHTVEAQHEYRSARSKQASVRQRLHQPGKNIDVVVDTAD